MVVLIGIAGIDLLALNFTAAALASIDVVQERGSVVVPPRSNASRSASYRIDTHGELVPGLALALAIKRCWLSGSVLYVGPKADPCTRVHAVPDWYRTLVPVTGGSPTPGWDVGTHLAFMDSLSECFPPAATTRRGRCVERDHDRYLAERAVDFFTGVDGLPRRCCRVNGVGEAAE